jgi:hypothetical protein
MGNTLNVVGDQWSVVSWIEARSVVSNQWSVVSIPIIDI